MSVNSDDLAHLNIRITNIENYINFMNNNMLEMVEELETTMKPIIKRLGEMDVQVKQHEHFIKELKQRFESAKRLSQQAQADQANNCNIL